jgi:hypothetical protein|uniref:Ellis van Creveld protein 2 like protein n=1 Tax=Inoviridae sp. ctTUL13 TaxID=2825782 RepID=A0A8S5UQ76_9VIRU|nr:MAG TPA: Ellis van Creveld protein 2 like protein [Inoviridae sp. ctTUL13]DAW35938.1 MAG TPA: Ellis van Creveld protein 2 like protein [Inoviridae sp.]DAW36604.1 MAG TPA: Ellis van Creveld protein 2 like protein [Inoviridae sp.]
MIDLGLSAEQYHFLMALSGILVGFLLNLIFVLLINKI